MAWNVIYYNKTSVGYLGLTLYLLFSAISRQTIAKFSRSSSYPADKYGNSMHFLLTLLPLYLKSQKWLTWGSNI